MEHDSHEYEMVGNCTSQMATQESHRETESAMRRQGEELEWKQWKSSSVTGICAPNG